MLRGSSKSKPHCVAPPLPPPLRAPSLPKGGGRPGATQPLGSTPQPPPASGTGTGLACSPRGSLSSSPLTRGWRAWGGPSRQAPAPASSPACLPSLLSMFRGEASKQREKKNRQQQSLPHSSEVIENKLLPHPSSHSEEREGQPGSPAPVLGPDHRARRAGEGPEGAWWLQRGRHLLR